MRIACLVCLVLSACRATSGPAEPAVEKSRYVRRTSLGPRTECTFTVERSASGRAITSVTERGKTVLTVFARYDAADNLMDAEVKLNTGGTVTATVVDGRAVVRQEGRKPMDFAVAKGVIVTSAPDWTDTFSLCRRYDAERGGKQEFEGLWIHPTKNTLRPTFSAEKTGEESVRYGGKSVTLFRLLLRLRNNSRYAAWVDERGRMIELFSLPYRKGGFRMVLEGFEETTAGLKPE